MNLMFWKKKTQSADDTEDPQTPPDAKTMALDPNAPVAPAKTGLIARIKSGLAGLFSRSGKAQAPDAEDGGSESAAAGAPAIKPIRTKKRLIIGGAIGLLVLLLAGIGFATWKIFLSHPEPKPATTEISHAGQPAPHTEISQAEIEALKKKNAELQTQLEAIKQQPPAAPQAGEKTAPASSSGSGELTISNKDPKAAAQALKAAIEEMNAAPGGRKPAK